MKVEPICSGLVRGPRVLCG